MSVEYLLMTNKWKEFLQNLTTEWLIENYQSTIPGRLPNRIEEGNPTTVGQSPTRVDTYTSTFKVNCGRTRFCFNTPKGLSELSFFNDEALIDYLPMNAWKDFIRIIDL